MIKKITVFSIIFFFALSSFQVNSLDIDSSKINIINFNQYYNEDIIVYTANQNFLSRIYILNMDGDVLDYFQYDNFRFCDTEVVNNSLYVAEAFAPRVEKVNLTNGELEVIVDDWTLFYFYDLAFDGTFFYVDEWDLNRYDINGDKDGMASFDETVYGSTWDGNYFWTLTDDNIIKCWNISNWPNVFEVTENNFSPPSINCRGLWFDGDYFWTAESYEDTLGYIYQFNYMGTIVNQWIEPAYSGWSACVIKGEGNNPPNNPCNPNPSNHESNVSINTDLSWTGGDPDGDLVTYDVYFGTSSTPPEVSSDQSNTSYDPGILEYDTKYYWKIVATDINDTSTSGSLWDFTTIIQNNPPNNPSNPNPSNHESNVSINTDLSWTGGDPDGDLVTYDVYFGTSSTPPNVATGYTNTSYILNTLDYETQYYWKIDAWDNNGASTKGNLWKFNTADNTPPYKPSNPNPSNNSNNINLNTNISWTGGDFEGDPVTYDIYFGKDPNPPNVAKDQFFTIYNPGPLSTNTKYYWRIDAWDNNDQSTTGDLWNFQTKDLSENNPPNKPEINGPPSGKIGVSYDFTISSTDPDGDHVYYYIEWFSGCPNVYWDGPYRSGEEITKSYIWENKGDHIITVKVKDEHDLEGESASFEISVTKSKILNLQDFLLSLFNNHPIIYKIFIQ